MMKQTSPADTLVPFACEDQPLSPPVQRPFCNWLHEQCQGISASHHLRQCDMYCFVSATSRVSQRISLAAPWLTTAMSNIVSLMMDAIPHHALRTSLPGNYAEHAAMF